MQKGIFVATVACTVLAAICAAQPVIIQNPEDKAAKPGAVVSFSVAAQGDSPLAYQWQFNGQDIPTARARVLRVVASPTRAGTYSVRVADSSGERRSAPAKLQVMPRPTVVVQPRSTVVGVHQTAQFSVQVNGSGPFTRMIWHNSNPLEGSHEIPPQAADGVDTTTLTIVDCANNDSYNGVYWFAVTNAVGGTVSRRVRLNVVDAPRFREEPQDKFARSGAVVTFRVVMLPDAAPWKTYQWYHENDPIPGATRPTLRVRASPEAAGYFSCVVSSIGGSSESFGALLTVQ